MGDVVVFTYETLNHRTKTAGQKAVRVLVTRKMGDFGRQTMGRFGKRSSSAPSSQPEQCVKVHIRLSNAEFGTSEERESIYKVSGMLEEAIALREAGEFDGDEFGQGECVLFMYGPDANKLFDAVLPILRVWQALKGGYAVKRFGPPGSRSEQVEFK